MPSHAAAHPSGVDVATLVFSAPVGGSVKGPLMRPYPGQILTLGALVALAGCQGSTTEPTPVPTTNLVIAAESATVSAQPSSGVTFQADSVTQEYAWMTTLNIVLTLPADEPALTITNFIVAVQQTEDGAVVAPPAGEAERFHSEVRTMTTRIEPGGEVTVQFDVWYLLPNLGRDAIISVALSFGRDDGNLFSGAISVQTL